MPSYRALQLTIYWAAWLYPFVFRAPHNQKRASITVSGPTLAGLFFELLSVALALVLRLPAASPGGAARIVASCCAAVLAWIIAWTSVTHLGRQFRIRAGLYQDHQLIRTGPYAVVRHPIYASFLAILAATLLLNTPWQWTPLPLAAFLIGTELRVRSEDQLLESRFGEQFRQYQRSVRAYIPLVR